LGFEFRRDRDGSIIATHAPWCRRLSLPREDQFWPPGA
jgi:hypothetical protein